MNLKYKVLCIGVNKVPGMRRLNYAEKDAETAAKYFETLKNKADITLLTRENATMINILNWVKECSTVQEELTVIIFFAGHGSAEKNEKTKSLERCLWIDGNFNVPFDSHQLKTSEVLKLLSNPFHKLVFLIDACYNFDPKQEVSIQDIFKQFKESERMIALKQYAIISASAVNQVALEDPRLGHGVLAYYFLQTMAGKYSFFLRKKIPFFKVLATLDKKVRNHRFLTDTGRKVTLKILLENGIMVHWNDTNFELPVLEPIPYIEDSRKNRFQEKLSRWAHFFKRTRLRNKIRLTVGILAVALVLLIPAHLSIVRIHFEYMGPTQKLRNSGSSYSFIQQTKFYNFLLGDSGLFLSGMSPERAGLITEKNMILFLFKHNWLDAFLPRLDEKGKIILLGNYLGYPILGVGETQLVEFALDKNNRDHALYWHPRDVNKLLGAIQKEYKHFKGDKKKAALRLLAELGKNGKDTALNIFDFKNETDQELRDLFLKHFYSPCFWEKNASDFGLYDYLCLIRINKKAPFPNTQKSDKKIVNLLSGIAQCLPDADSRITSTDKLSAIYGKLEILALFGSAHFKKKASNIFKIAFDPDNVIDLILICTHFNDRMWLFEQYFKRIQGSDITWSHWWKFTHDLFEKITQKEKSKIIKFLINTKFQSLLNDHMDDLFWDLRNSDSNIVRLSDWENWIKKYRASRYPALLTIVKVKSPRIFGFIETHYHYFKENFSGYLFEELYKWNAGETIKLVKKLYDIGSPKDKLCCAIFLYGKNYKGYATFIINFLREARNSRPKQDILRRFYSTLTKVLIHMVETHQISRDELKFLFNDRNLFYTFDELNLYLWPREVKKILLTARIPHSHIQGIPLLRACEELPEPYREKMLVKICKSNIDETFRLNAESSLIKHYPKIFLKWAYKKGYHLKRFKQGRVVDAYRKFSYKELKRQLNFSFKIGMYGAVGFIVKALIRKEADGQLSMQQLQHILQEFDRPVERMLLRNLRHHCHKRFFSGEKNGRAI